MDGGTGHGKRDRRGGAKMVEEIADGQHDTQKA